MSGSDAEGLVADGDITGRYACVWLQQWHVMIIYCQNAQTWRVFTQPWLHYRRSALLQGWLLITPCTCPVWNCRVPADNQQTTDECSYTGCYHTADGRYLAASHDNV